VEVHLRFRNLYNLPFDADAKGYATATLEHQGLTTSVARS